MIVRTVRALRSLLARQIRGSFPPALVGTDSSGDRGEIGYGRDPRATLVFTFTKECPECQESWQALRTAQSLSPSSLRIARALRGRVPCNFRRHTRRRFGRAAPHRLPSVLQLRYELPMQWAGMQHLYVAVVYEVHVRGGPARLEAASGMVASGPKWGSDTREAARYRPGGLTCGLLWRLLTDSKR